MTPGRTTTCSPTSGKSAAFLTASAARPHLPRRRAILDRHPDVKRLIGRDRRTALLLVIIVGLQIAIAAAIGHLGPSRWWIALIAAYAIGAFAAHALFVLIHEACHNSIFKSPALNKTAGIFADLANAVPTAIAFRCYHIKHHSHLGDYDFDADLPSEWEVRTLGREWYGKATWLFLFPVLQVFRLGRLKGTMPTRSRWMAANALLVVAADIAIGYAFGPTSLLYLAASLYFSIGGLHILSARLVQEHFTLDAAQETAGYYGPLNFVALNAGYHNEHHDFPDVPWSRLPALKAAASEFYSDLRSYESWGVLLATFIFDKRFTLHSRVTR